MALSALVLAVMSDRFGQDPTPQGPRAEGPCRAKLHLLVRYKMSDGVCGGINHIYGC